jgi:hypothetical protein
MAEVANLPLVAARGDHSPYMSARGAVAVLLGVSLCLLPARAFGWQEAHQTGQEVTAQVDPSGNAAVNVRVRWHIVRGPLKSIDLVNVDAAAVLEPNVTILTEGGRALAAHAGRRDEKTVRITVDEPHALMRGNFVFDVRWRVDLNAARALVRDGASWRLTLSEPVAPEGFDGGKTAITLPAAPDAPQPIVADTGAVDDGAVATLHRQTVHDVLELVRPHVARGEAVTWTLRVDRRAFGQVADPHELPAFQAPPTVEPDRIREVSLAAGLGAMALAFGLVVAHKSRVFAAACAACGARGRGLLPLPDAARAVLAGVALAAGVGLQIAVEGAMTAGAICIALATLAASLRAPNARPAARGPGRWLALRPEDAFARRGASRHHWLDPGSNAGRAAALLFAALVMTGAVAAHRVAAEGPWLVVLDSAALVPLFATGLSSQLPPHAGRSAAPWIARAFRRLRATHSLRVAPWARIADAGDSPAALDSVDELRLLVLPRAAMPGVVGIELGLAWSSTPVGWASSPEVLARVLDGSAAAAKLASDAVGVRVVPGRRPNERVAVLVPRSPTRASAVALVRAVAAALTDRRVAYPAKFWTAPERRVAWAASTHGAEKDAKRAA